MRAAVPLAAVVVLAALFALLRGDGTPPAPSPVDPGRAADDRLESPQAQAGRDRARSALEGAPPEPGDEGTAGVGGPVLDDRKEPYSVDVYALTTAGDSLLHALAGFNPPVDEQCHVETDAWERLALSADRDAGRTGYAGTLNLRRGGERRVSFFVGDLRLADALVQPSAPVARFVLDVEQVVEVLATLEFRVAPVEDPADRPVVLVSGRGVWVRWTPGPDGSGRLGFLAPGDYTVGVEGTEGVLAPSAWNWNGNRASFGRVAVETPGGSIPLESMLRDARELRLSPGQTLDLGVLRED